MNKKPLVLLVAILLVSSLACNILSPGAIEQAVKDAGQGAAQTAIAMGEGTAQAVAKTAMAGALKRLGQQKQQKLLNQGNRLR